MVERPPSNPIPLPKGVFICPACGAAPVKVTHTQEFGSTVITSTYSCPEHLWQTRWCA